LTREELDNVIEPEPTEDERHRPFLQEHIERAMIEAVRQRYPRLRVSNWHGCSSST